jgi:hypothetical protein
MNKPIKRKRKNKKQSEELEQDGPYDDDEYSEEMQGNIFKVEKD